MTTATLLQTGTWTLDPAHTVIGFVARHLMVTKVRGGFASFTGAINLGDTPETSSVEVSIDTASFGSGAADRDGHIRSADFLDVENHPAITFRSTAVRALGRDEYEIDGDLRIKDVTRPVTLATTFEGVQGDPWGGTRAGFTAATTINREDWGLTWNVPLDGGGVLVGKEIKIEIEVEAVLAS
jgi:polyisoprenoid-binding protein YceI